MNNALMIVFGLLANFILYLAFGSLITRRKNREWSLLMTIVVGFFFYYTVFFVFCIPIMQYYRPMTMLTKTWLCVVAVITILSACLNGKAWVTRFMGVIDWIKKHPYITLCIGIIVAVQVVLVCFTYNFTLDAAYYVANVGTSVDTNMMNVYDPFTGAWQDHFEVRYFFATYSIQDAIVCQVTGIPALIWTKSVMALTIIILTNIVYFLIAKKLFNNDYKASTVMMGIMLFVNLTFYTIYTSSEFLMTRTYEGKAIVGNLSLFTVFYVFILMTDNEDFRLPWLTLFIICFGSTTISSSANMLIPVEVTVLFIPYIVRSKAYKQLVKYIACVVPGVVFSLAYVLYVKGYFVLYTYPRHFGG